MFHRLQLSERAGLAEYKITRLDPGPKTQGGAHRLAPGRPVRLPWAYILKPYGLPSQRGCAVVKTALQEIWMRPT